MHRSATTALAAAFVAICLASVSAADDGMFLPNDQADVYAATTIVPPQYGEDQISFVADDGGQPYWSTICNVELTFLRFGLEGGVVDNAGEAGTFGISLSPRLELGRQRDDGVGTRVRYWTYNQSTVTVDNPDIEEASGQTISANTFVMDGEFVQDIDLNNLTSLEVAAGVRYLEFDLDLGTHAVANDIRYKSHFDGLGITFGTVLRRQARYGNLYAKARGSLLMDDIELSGKSIVDPASDSKVVGNDHPVTQIELGIGYEKARYFDNGAVLRVRVGLESQQWLSVAARKSEGAGVPLRATPDNGTDAAFAGFLVGGELSY